MISEPNIEACCGDETSDLVGPLEEIKRACELRILYCLYIPRMSYSWPYHILFIHVSAADNLKLNQNIYFDESVGAFCYHIGSSYVRSKVPEFADRKPKCKCGTGWYGNEVAFFFCAVLIVA